MVSAAHGYCRDRRAALVMLVAAGSVQVCWQHWESVGVSVVELLVEHSGVDPEGCPRLRGAVAGNYEEAVPVSHRIDPAVEDVLFLEPGVELPDLRGRRLDQLLDAEELPAVVPKTDRMTVHDVAALLAVGVVGLGAWGFEMRDGLADSRHLLYLEGGCLEQPSVAEDPCHVETFEQHAGERRRVQGLYLGFALVAVVPMVSPLSAFEHFASALESRFVPCVPPFA